MKHIVMCSGGKDSVAMLVRMLELNMPVTDIVFCNTTLEYPEMYKYVRELEKKINRKITWVNPKKTFNHWFYGKFTKGKQEGIIRGMPYVVGHSWCCREFKINPTAKDFKPSGQNLLYLGMAKGEEHRIQEGKTQIKYPLIEWGWTEEKCLRYTKEKGVYNKLYNDFKRLGCWLCPKQSKESLRILYENYPKMWKLLRKYENDSPHGFHPDYKLKDLEHKWKYQTKLISKVTRGDLR